MLPRKIIVAVGLTAFFALLAVGLASRLGLHDPQNLGSSRALAAPPKISKDSRAEDRAAIRKAMNSFLKAFESGDAKRVAAHWTEEGEYIANDGTKLQGRETIQKGYAAFFEKHKKLKTEVQMESLRFPSRDTAIEEGFMVVTRGAEPATESRYSVLHVRQDGKWLMAVVREWPRESATLRDLHWLIGTWAAKRKDGEVHTTYEWMWDKAFVRANFTIKNEDRSYSGMQIIGKDPSTGQLRSWTFERNGGFGVAAWTRDGKQWTIDSVGILADGTTLTANIILTPLSKDAFIWHPTNRTLGGEEVANLPPIKVTRVKTKK